MSRRSGFGGSALASGVVFCAALSSLLLALLLPVEASGGAFAATERPAAPSSVAAPSLAPAPADRAALERAYEQSKAKTERPEPGFGEYIGHLLRRFAEWIGDLLASTARATGISPRIVVYLGWGLLGVALLVVAVALYRRYGRRRDEDAAPTRSATGGSTGEPELLRPAAGWREEIDRHLAAGRVTEALEAVWWWLARSLCGEQAEASWTGRELVIHGRRPELASPVAQLDAWIYGPRPPQAAEVSDWVRGLAPRLTGER